jgi:predicted AAA+ superfamily ATPase
VRRVLDRRDTRIVVTGSSAQLLSREITTSLRGRALATETTT